MKDVAERLAILFLALLCGVAGILLTVSLIILADISRTDVPAGTPPPPIENSAPAEMPRQFSIPNYTPDPDKMVTT